MAVYTRQSSFADGDTITAALFNNEFNQLLAAFNVSTGHTHDGSTTGDGGPLSTLYSNAISFGTGADTDIVVTFNANTADGVITWMEDEDYFKISDDILINSTEKIQFYDTAIYIYSSTDGQLDLVADTEVQIAATTIDINGNVDVSGTLTVAGNTSFGDANITNVGSIALDSITNDGTDITLDSSNDIVLDAEGGNIEFKDAGTLQLSLDMDGTANVQIVKLGVDSDDLVFQQYDGNEVVRIADDRRLYFYDKGGEYIYGDGTDLHIVSGADINIPANVGLTFGDDGEKIEGDGTDLTITGNNINLTATADVVLAANTGLVLDGSGNEKIESDGTDISISVGSGGDINIPADIGVTFGNDGEKIEGDGTDLTISGNNINLTASADVVIPTNIGLHFTDSNEKIESDGTDLTINSGNDINLTATTDINVPANVGVTFGDDAEKIEGDGTDLTISGNNINLTATADVNIPSGVGLTFATAEKIESDGTDLSFTVGSGGDINIPANIGLTFGDDGEKIEGDGTDLVISANNLTIDAAADIVLDADDADVVLKDAGTQYAALTNSSGNLIIKSGSTTMLTGSGANATFAGDVSVGGDLDVSGSFDMSDLNITNVGSIALDTITNDGTDITLDSSGDIVLDAGGADVIFKDDGTAIGTFTNSSSDFVITSNVQDKDIVFKGDDGGSAITALTLDMSEAGAATFNDKIVATELDISGNVDIDGTLETDALTINGTTLAETIADTVGDMVSSNTETGITVSYQDGDNTLDFALGAAQTTITSLLATDIKIGEDDETKIDFETADTINFYAGNEKQLILTDGALTPGADNILDLGSSGVEFKDAYFDGTVTADAFSGPLTGTLQTAAQGNVTSLGTLTALTVDDVAVNGKVITMTGSTDDTAVFTAGTNGTLSIVTTDTAAAAANITITADGTFEADGTTITLDSAGDIVLDAAGNNVIFKSAGTSILDISNSSSDAVLTSSVQDKDIIFKGDDGGSAITALTLDMSEAGAATFNDKIVATELDISGNIDIDGTSNLDVVDIDGAVDMASTLQVDGAITSSDGAVITTADNTDTLSLVSTDADANFGPNLRLYRNSGSPADDDLLSIIKFEGRNDNSQDVVYGRIFNKISDASDGTEDGIMRFDIMKAGSLIEAFAVNPTELVINDGSDDYDFRVESNGDANALFVNGSTDNVGIGEDTPLAKLHVKSADSSIGTLNASANTLCVEGSGNAGITIASGNTSNSMLAFGDQNDADRAFINYDHNADKLAVNVAAAERMAIESDGDIFMAKSSAATTTVGHEFRATGLAVHTVDGNDVMILERLSSDGNMLIFSQAGSTEGIISVSGSTMTYGGFSGQHESSGIATNTPIGTVVSTIDELDVYPTGTAKAGQNRADHAKVEVSDNVGDSAVYGVVSRFDENDKVFVTSVGIGSVRVTGACAKGDLLESNGDGTAKVQSDDIIRSKTLGKVTIGNSNTGVKLVPCVMYCG